MKVFFKICFIFLFLLTGTFGYAQKSKLNKAQREYDKFAYINAQKIYLEVVNQGFTSPEIYERLGNTYYFNSDYENAAIWYEKLINEFQEKAEPKYYFRAAQSLKSQGKYASSDTLMSKYVELGKRPILIENLKSDSDYLTKIKAKPKRWKIEPVEVNTDYTDFGPAFYMDKIVYASSKPDSTLKKVTLYEWNMQPFFDMYEADMDENGKLSKAQLIPGQINTKLHESTAVFTKDGNTVYFTRNNFTNGRKGKDREENIRLKIYKATKVEDKWSNVVELPFNNVSYSTAHPALSPNEKRLYFTSDRPGTFGEGDLWYVDIRGENEYGAPVNLGENINTEVRETFPFISSDNILYFATNGRAGLGGLDIFYTPLDNNGMPSEIFIMGEPVNSNKDDFGFIVDPVKQLAFLSSNRNTTNANDNIYRGTQKCNIKLIGTVKDQITQELLADVEVALFNEENTKIDSSFTDIEGAYNFRLECESLYSVRAIKDNYDPAEKVIDTPDETSEMTVAMELKMIGCPPNDLGCRLSLQPIYFDFDKSDITLDAEVELAKIWVALKEYPGLNIDIQSHTDSRGSDEYNMELSERRAQSTLQWFLNRGIDKERLTAKGYGETKLVNECTNDVICSAEKHDLNRRSVFLIVE